MHDKQKPNFKKPSFLASNILMNSKIISTFPFSMVEVIKENSDIRCRTYKKAKEYNLCMSDFGSDSASLFEYKGRRMIFYNQDEMQERIQFSCAHEFGHHMCKHKLQVQDDAYYNCCEVEANYFAAQLLMPEQIIREFMKRGKEITPEFLMNVFGVSHDAAKKRIETLNKLNPEWHSDVEKFFDKEIVKKYLSFIDRVAPIPQQTIDMFEFDEKEVVNL